MKQELSHKVMWAGCILSKYKLQDVELPWRQRRTPYRIFLAEMLLVRTRADVVTRIYEDIFEQYPDIDALAQADEGELRAALKPLGLAKRVPFFIKAAGYICEVHDGKIPKTVEDLLKVPGLGIYTAPAIATFAYGQEFVPADVNILRFLARVTGLEMKHKTKGSKALWDLLPFLEKVHTGLLAENLLDFTRIICRSRTPRCERCPLTTRCSYFQDRKQ